jgi:hypothetical protein
MNNDELRTLVGQLKAEIDVLAPADEEARERLGALVDDLERRLDDPQDTALPEHDDFMDGLKETVERFEVEHPRATGIINNIMVMLGNMGI